MSGHPNRIFIGTAGWSIPKTYSERFPTDGSHLERYAHCLPGVEINSSFYRPHKPQTYERWALTVSDDFKFAVKVPKVITHEHRLRDADEFLYRFLGEATTLGSKLGPLLVQLPPSLRFDATVVHHFFAALRKHFDGEVVCEPRHDSWFAPDAERIFIDFQVARVAADPAVVPQAGEPGGWGELVYYRLHGSPRIYYSDYSTEYLDGLMRELHALADHATVWCIFDNTAEFAATGNALDVLDRLGQQYSET